MIHDTWLDAVPVVGSAIALAAVAFAIHRGARGRTTWSLSLVVLAWTGISVSFALVPSGTLSVAAAVQGYAAYTSLFFAGVFLLALTYLRLPPVVAGLLDALTFLPFVVVLVVLALDAGHLTGPTGTLSVAGARIVGIVFAGLHIVPFVLLAWRWSNTIEPAARGRVTWIMLPLAFAAIHDGVAIAVTTYIAPWSASPWDAPPGWIAPLFLPALGVLVWMAVGLATRLVRREALAGDRTVALVLLASFGASVVNLAGVRAHVALDTGFLLVLFYGVARYQVLDLDLKVKLTVSRGTVVALFAGLVFVASEVLEQLLGVDQLVPAVLAAAVVSLALRPLLRVGERVADRLMPGVEDTAAYRGQRGVEIYRAAFASATTDGEITSKERAVLATLAEHVGLSHARAREIERESGTERGVAP